LLSHDSFENLQLELKRLKDNSPPASGIGIDHPAYIPEDLMECKEKIRRLQERLSWSRQICFLSEIIQRDGRRKIKILEKENQLLKEKQEDLENALERTRNQLQTALGIKKSKSPKEESSEPRPSDKKKRKGDVLIVINRLLPLKPWALQLQ
jgi:sugar-specific transcriptional regulator TrmB